MRMSLYKNPETTGWLGWIEDADGNAKGFVKLDGTIIPWDEGFQV